MLKLSEIRNMDVGAIKGKIEDLKIELFNLRMQKVAAGVEKSHLFSDFKKDVARLSTVLTEKTRK